MQDFYLISKRRPEERRLKPTVANAAVLLFRLGNRLGKVHANLGLLIKAVNHVLTGADLAWQADIGPGLQLKHPTGVVWGPHTKAGSNLIVQQGVTIGGNGGRDNGFPTIGNNVDLGAGSRILGPITIGDRVMVGANAVVIHDVPAGSIAVGVPARILGRGPEGG